MCGVQERAEITERPEIRIDVAIIGDVVAAAMKSLRLTLLSSELHDVAGNTLPLTATLHPGVGESKHAIELLALLGRALFVRRPNDDCNVWSVAVHRELFVHGRLVRVF